MAIHHCHCPVADEAKLPTAQRGDLRASLAALERCLALSANIADESPVDVLGAIADAHADLGDLERAGQVSSTTSAEKRFVRVLYVLGACADAHADLGDLERAGQVSTPTSLLRMAL